MTKEERAEITNLPPKYRPLTAWNYFWLTVLFAVPIVGFVFTIVFSFSRANINRRSFARSYFCVLIIVAAIALIMILTGVIGNLFNK